MTTGEEPGLVLGQGSALDGDGVRHAVSVEGDDVQEALDEDRFGRLGDRDAGPVEAVEMTALRVDRGLRRIQVLRLTLADDAGAEGDDLLRDRSDREDHALAEAVVDP